MHLFPGHHPTSAKDRLLFNTSHMVTSIKHIYFYLALGGHFLLWEGADCHKVKAGNSQQVTQGFEHNWRSHGTDWALLPIYWAAERACGNINFWFWNFFWFFFFFRFIVSWQVVKTTCSKFTNNTGLLDSQVLGLRTWTSLEGVETSFIVFYLCFVVLATTLPLSHICSPGLRC
jgi:hypothetical protein